RQREGRVLRVKAPAAVPAAGVLEEVLDRDLIEAWILLRAGRRLEVVQDDERLVIELQLAVLDQLEDGDAGDGLGDAGDAEAGLELDHLRQLEVRVAVAVIQLELTILGDCKLSTGDLPPRHDPPHDLVESLELRDEHTGGWHGGFANARRRGGRRRPLPADQRAGHQEAGDEEMTPG